MTEWNLATPHRVPAMADSIVNHRNRQAFVKVLTSTWNNGNVAAAVDALVHAPIRELMLAMEGWSDSNASYKQLVSREHNARPVADINKKGGLV